MTQILGRIRMPNLSGAPSSPLTGEMYYDNTSTPGTLYYWNGNAWVSGGSGGGGTTTYEQPGAPPAGNVGDIWIDTDDAPPTVVPRRTGFTWAIKGTLIAETQPSFFVPIATGQVTKLIGVRAKIASGTSIVCAITRNGTSQTFVGGGGNLTVTPTVTTTLFLAATQLADADEIALVQSSPTGSPTALSLTVFLEHSA